MSALHHVLLVENALGQTPEESWPSVFQNVPARTQGAPHLNRSPGRGRSSRFRCRQSREEAVRFEKSSSQRRRIDERSQGRSWYRDWRKSALDLLAMGFVLRREFQAFAQGLDRFVSGESRLVGGDFK